MTPQEFFDKAYPEAVDAHIYPEFACCEAALESGWGTSKLCLLANNLFGQKAGSTTAGSETIDLLTHEWDNGHLIEVAATWPKFDDWAGSFRARMALLIAHTRYAAALAAPDGERFVRCVSLVWATDPDRADKVLTIYRKHWPQDFPAISA